VAVWDCIDKLFADSSKRIFLRERAERVLGRALLVFLIWKFTLRINDRCKKSSAGKSLRTTFDKKWQWLIIIDESSRDKSELEEEKKSG